MRRFFLSRPSARRTGTLAAPALSLLALAAAGCNRPAAPTPSQTSVPAEAPGDSSASGPIDPERIERLRSLGYLDTSGLPKAGAGSGAHLLIERLAAPGYTLVVFAGSCSCQLLTLHGEIVRSWKDGDCHRWEHAELLPDGDLVVVGARFDQDKVADPIESGRYLMRLSWDGRVVWRKEINAHHDVSLTPDGRLLTLVLARRRIPAIDPDHDVADDLMTILSPDGKIVESVSLYDVLSISKIPFTFQKAGGGEAGEHRIVDLLHSNSIRWVARSELSGRSPLYGEGTVLVTSRHQDELMIIDWPRRQLLWHWGRGVVSGPHEASVVGDGRILVFDNGLARGWSRVLELNPLAPAELVQYAPGPARFFSRVMGSCQRLANGNTLIVNSEGAAAFELTPAGAPVWIYEGTQATADGHRVKIIRMRRIPEAFISSILSRRGR